MNTALQKDDKEADQLSLTNPFRDDAEMVKIHQKQADELSPKNTFKDDLMLPKLKERSIQEDDWSLSNPFREDIIVEQNTILSDIHKNPRKLSKFGKFKRRVASFFRKFK
jgi:hypothetical protein